MQIGDSSMVEHVSRSHKVPGSNPGRLLLFAFWLQSTSSKFLRCSSSLVAVRAIIPHPASPTVPYPRVQSSQSFCRVKFNSPNIPRKTPIKQRVLLSKLQPTSSGTLSASDKVILKRRFVGSPRYIRTYVRTFLSVRFRATRPFLNKTPSSTTYIARRECLMK